MSLSVLKEEAEPLTVAEALGLEIRKYGNRNSILCPCHNDIHFGSCFLTETGFKCFSCGAHGDVFKLVQSARNVGFQDSVKFVAGLYGGLNRFGVDMSVWKTKTITKDECAKIGIKNKPVYLKIGETFHDNPEYNRDGFKTEIIIESLWEDCHRYAILECIEQNPMKALFNANKWEYHRLIKDSCEKTVQKYTLFSDKIKSQPRDKTINALVNKFGLENMLSAIEEVIKEVNRIKAKYGNVSEETKPNSNSENSDLLSLIKTANSAFLAEENAPF